MEKRKGGMGGQELICGAHFIFDPRYRLEFDQFHSITSLFIFFLFLIRFIAFQPRVHLLGPFDQPLRVPVG